MSFGGGGGTTGGTVVGGPTPWAASLAGQLQSQSAQAAADAARQQTTDAINLIRQNYAGAIGSLKPYTSEGIQALDQLNQYMGLNAYNPGTAPTAPVKYTAKDVADQISQSAINNYINQNTTVGQFGGSYHPVYTGVGADDPNIVSAYDKPGANYQTTPGQLISGWAMGGPLGNTQSGVTGQQAFGGYVSDPVRMMLAGELANQKNQGYDSSMQVYNQQMDLYNQAKGLQQQYDAQGPLTPEQVQQKLMEQPGVAFQYNQGLDAVQRAASSKGMLGSGRLLQALSDYGQGVASQQYGATLSRLAGLVSAGQQASTDTSNMFANLGNSTGQLTNNLGDTLANSFLAAGNAQAQGLLAANQQYQILGQQSTGGGDMSGFGSMLGGLGSLIGTTSTGASGLTGLFSSKALKDKVSTPSTEEILTRVKSLDIDKWKYKGTSAEHIGPYAEDFRDKFGVGDGQTINIIDYLGVLLGAVKELSNKIDNIERR